MYAEMQEAAEQEAAEQEIYAGMQGATSKDVSAEVCGNDCIAHTSTPL